jgi:hypothetical protein
MQTMTEDGFTLLLAACVRQAIEDYRDGYTHSNRPDAAAFLTSAGLLSPDGELDPRFVHTPKQRRVPTTSVQHAAA